MNESVVPDIYADSTQISTTPYGVTITLGRTPPHHAGPTPPIAEKLTVVRMSLEHAKVIAMLLRKQLKAFERANGEIPLPPELFTTLGVAKEDWGLQAEPTYVSDLLDSVREAVRTKSYVISLHMLGRLLDRGIDLGDVAQGLVSDSSEVIEDYPARHHGPCCLILCRGPSGRWYHVVCSYPPIVTMVTEYEPDPARLTADFRRRLDPQ